MVYMAFGWLYNMPGVLKVGIEKVSKLCSFPPLVFNSRMYLYLPLQCLNLIMNYAYADMVIVLNAE